MSENNFKEYVKAVRELNSLLEEFSKYDYKGSYCEKIICDIKKDIDLFQKVKVGIEAMKNDYADRTGVYINDVNFKDMENYYLLYSKHNKDSICCYDINEKFMWKASINDKLVCANNDAFMIAIVNEDLEENQISGYTCCLMKYEDDKIRRVTGSQIEDVIDFYELNENLVVFRLNNDEKSHVYDKNMNKFIIENVDYVIKFEDDYGDFKKNECIVTKLFDFDELSILSYFYINSSGYIISDMIDSNGKYYIIENKDEKEKYVETLESKFDSIRKRYQEKGYQLVKK